MLSAIVCLFIVILKAVAKDLNNDVQVHLAVNGMDLILVKTNLSVNEYDGETHYTYVDGEVVDLFCDKINYRGSLRLNYYDSGGYPLIQTDLQTMDRHNFRSRLTLTNNNSYIDCIYTKDPALVYNYRTTFIMNNENLEAKARQDTLIVSVNGLKLVPIPLSDTKRYDNKYRYKYIEGDVLNITCQKSNENMKGNLEFLYDKSALKIKVRRDDLTGAIEASINTNLYDNIPTLSCHISSTDAKKDATITFLPDLPITDKPRLLGLDSKNVEFQYSNGENHWTIAYQGTVNETLNLTCVLKRSQYDVLDTEKLQWEFGEEIIDFSQKYNIYNIYNTTLIQDTRSFAIEERHNQTRIACVDLTFYRHYDIKRIVEVILDLKPQLSLETDNDQVSDLTPRRSVAEQDTSACRGFLAVAETNAESMRMLAAATQLQAEAAKVQAEASLLFARATNKIGDALVLFANKNN